MARKCISLFIFIIGGFSIFVIGYIMGRYDDNIFKKVTQDNIYEFQLADELGETKPTILNLHNYEIAEDSIIEFRIKCSKDKWRVERIETLSSLGLDGSTISEINSMYGKLGYIIREVSSNKIVVERNLAKYYPNKYVITMENNDLVICKSGNNGEIFDINGEYINEEEYGNTGINVKVYEIRDDYIVKIITGDEEMQFDNLNEALLKLNELI
ncbi:hypothetical protein [Clostridium sp. DL1XJH146]